MILELYQVDAFASQAFTGNPAAVCPLDTWLPDTVMQSIAAENNLSETAFFVPSKAGFHIRWFTPTAEVNLCGHATLAAAHVIFEELHFSKLEIHFISKSGSLFVSKNSYGLQLNFPNQLASPCATPEIITSAFGQAPELCLSNINYIAVFNDEAFVKTVTPDFDLLATLDLQGMVITSRSNDYDFISRCFAPKYGINEDPVTGSSFTELAPYWSQQLGKKRLNAKQVSKRGGEVHCELQGDRVFISGQSTLYLKGTIFI